MAKKPQNKAGEENRKKAETEQSSAIRELLLNSINVTISEVIEDMKKFEHLVLFLKKN